MSNSRHSSYHKSNILFYKFYIWIIRLLKSAMLTLLFGIIELLAKSFGLLDFLKKNIEYISFNDVLFAWGLLWASSFMFTIILYKQVSFLRILLERNFFFLLVLIGLLEIICLYKISSQFQFLICIIAAFLSFILIRFEGTRVVKYSFTQAGATDYYIDKPVCGRQNLTASQIKTLNLLEKLVNKRQSKDSFNIALLGSWGVGKTSITDTMIDEFEKSANYFVLKISAQTMRGTINIATYVRDYFENLFRHFEIGIPSLNVRFLSSLVDLLTDSKKWGELLTLSSISGFGDMEKEKELFKLEIQKLLKRSGRKNILLFIDDSDRTDYEEQIIELLIEFSQIDGIISIISMNDQEMKSTEKQYAISSNEKIYSQIDKYIHIRIRIEEGSHIINDGKLKQMMISEFTNLEWREDCYIDFYKINEKISMLDPLNDYSTTEKMGLDNLYSDYNILSELFWLHFMLNKKGLGEYLGELNNNYISETKELSHIVSAIKKQPLEEVEASIFQVYYKWTNSFEFKDYDYIDRLNDNTFQILCLLRDLCYVLDKLLEKGIAKTEITCVRDLYNYYNRILVGVTSNLVSVEMDMIEQSLLNQEELLALNSFIKNGEYKKSKALLVDKSNKLFNFYIRTLILSDFMGYMKQLLNNGRSVKMQFREAELLNLNYLDYLIRDWQPNSDLNQKMNQVKEFPMLQEIPGYSIPFLKTIINEVLFVNYILIPCQCDILYSEDEKRLYLVKGTNQIMIVISVKNWELQGAKVFDIYGNTLNDLTESDKKIIAERNRKIWSQ